MVSPTLWHFRSGGSTVKNLLNGGKSEALWKFKNCSLFRRRKLPPWEVQKTIIHTYTSPCISSIDVGSSQIEWKMDKSTIWPTIAGRRWLQRYIHHHLPLIHDINFFGIIIESNELKKRSRLSRIKLKKFKNCYLKLKLTTYLVKGKE